MGVDEEGTLRHPLSRIGVSHFSSRL
jgi:hypothetical protein